MQTQEEIIIDNLFECENCESTTKVYEHKKGDRKSVYECVKCHKYIDGYGGVLVD